MHELRSSNTEYIINLRRIYKGILGLNKNYHPSPIVDGLFSKLVKMAIKPRASHDFDGQEVADLQMASNASEVELERYWAKIIISSPDPQAEVEKFPYIGNYRELTEMELMALQNGGRADNFGTVTFVGGGLPLTAYVLARDHGFKSVVLDNDPVAASLAKEFVKRVGMEREMEIVECPGETFTGYGKLVIVAALAGVEDGVKERIFAQIPEQATVIARTVESETPRELLYKPLPAIILASRSVANLVHPRQTSRFQAVINSAAILEGY